ncbi:MAG: hypothetical protein U0791_15010 [Gemmataceae bacterium]
MPIDSQFRHDRVFAQVGVGEDQVPFARRVDQLLEVTLPDRGPSQQFGRGVEVVGVKNHRSLRPHRDVELPLQVDAVDAVETGPVQVHEAGGPRRLGPHQPVADRVVVFGVVVAVVPFEVPLDAGWVTLDRLIGRDQVFVRVSEQRPPGFQVKENRPAPQKRLDVRFVFRWEQVGVLCYEPPLTTRPFQKWKHNGVP